MPGAEVITASTLLSPPEWAAVFRRLAPFGNGNPCPALIVEAAELRGVRVRTRAPKRKAISEPTSTRDGAFWAFKASDIVDAVPLFERLDQRADPVSVFIRDALGEKFDYIQQYQDFKKHRENLPAALATGLNSVLNANNLFDRDRFARIKLRWQTKVLLRQRASGYSRVQPNRMLLEDAYPRELKKKAFGNLPKVWGYEGRFRDKITGLEFDAVWPAIEEAEMLWQVHEFLERRHCKKDPFVLPYDLRLQLQLCIYVPVREWSNVYRGAHFERDVRFQICQCIPIESGSLRMTDARKTR